MSGAGATEIQKNRGPAGSTGPLPAPYDADGEADGDADGTSLGDADGASLGEPDGTALGDADGTWAGDADGTALGDAVGAAVGAGVGTGVALGPHADRNPAIEADRTIVRQARFSIGFSLQQPATTSLTVLLRSGPEAAAWGLMQQRS